MAALTGSASGATLTWGSSGGGGPGTWTAVDAWYDGSAQATWNSTTPDGGVFAGASGTVTVTTATAQTLQFSTPGYTLQSGTLNIKGGVTVDSGTATISAAISGSGFAKSGGGTLRISNTSSSFTGTTSIAAGTLAWTSTGRNSFARGKRAYDIAAGATLKLDAGGTINFGSSVTGTTTLTGGGVFNVAAGTVFTSDNNNSGNVVMSLGPGAQIVVDGVMGASQIWLSSTYTRGLTFYANNKADLVINAGGRFNAQYSSALATPSLDIVVNSLLGSGTFDKSQPDPTNLKVGIANGSGTFAGSFIANSNGTNYMSSLTLIKVGTGTQTLSGTAAPGITFNVQEGGLLIDGTMSSDAGVSGMTTVSPGAVFGGTGLLGGSLTFASGSSMFLFNPTAPLTVGGTVTFADPATFGIANLAGLTNSVANGTYTLLSGSVTTTGLANFGSANAYYLGAGTAAYFAEVPGSMFQVVVSPGAPPAVTINVPSGTQTQTQAGYPTLSGATPVLKVGGGTLVLDQANTLTGSTTVQGGILRLANGSALASSRLVVVAGGTGQVAPVTTTSVASLDLASGNGLLDVTSGAITIASGMTGPQLVAEILEGRGDGSWSGTSGITSSAAAASVASSIPRAVGWIDNGDGSLTAAYAAPGDTNVDWSIDILDASNFLAGGKFDTGIAATWIEGDFSYDGIVDILDAADFFATGLYDAGNYNTAPGIGAVAAVPEPSMTSVLAAAIAAAAVIRRTRRDGRVKVTSG
ncbi:MAG: beta strand repeat-containing protein [Planctomycetaceae bacterium]